MTAIARRTSEDGQATFFAAASERVGPHAVPFQPPRIALHKRFGSTSSREQANRQGPRD